MRHDGNFNYNEVVLKSLRCWKLDINSSAIGYEKKKKLFIAAASEKSFSKNVVLRFLKSLQGSAIVEVGQPPGSRQLD